MKFLIIDSTKRQALLSLVNGNLAHTQVFASSEKHSETLMFNIGALLNENGCDIADLNAIACVSGPGSFTGIRIGMATAQAFHVATAKPLLSGNVFEIIAPAIKSGIMFLVCTSHSLYYAKIKNHEITGVGVVEVNELEMFVGKNKFYCLQDEQSLMPSTYNNFETISHYDDLVVNFFQNKLNQSDFTLSQNFSPYYIQLSQAERNLKEAE